MMLRYRKERRNRRRKENSDGMSSLPFDTKSRGSSTGLGWDVGFKLGVSSRTK